MLLTDKLYIDELSRPHTLDEHWMRVAILEAYKAHGFTKPNPLVGAVLVSPTGELLAANHHQVFGGPHAEVNVINQAKALGHNLKGATLYCTLEPCCHTDKKTPPCLPLVINEQIGRVVIGRIDPNPKVSGKSILSLKDAGIHVSEGVLAKACDHLIREFIHEHATNLPYTHLKIAQSLDGSHGPTIGHNSQARWMTNDSAKDYVHELRAISDAVAIGGETLRQDSPLLTCRLNQFSQRADFKQPTKLLLSSKIQEGEKLGFQTYRDIESLRQSSFKRILIEAGPSLMSQLIERHNFNELSIILAPCLLGNIQKLKFVQDYSLANSIQLPQGKWMTLGDNILFHWIKPNNV